MYACPNIATAVNVVHADRNTPGFMRAPPETPYMFALECAMDELAYALEHGPDRASPGQRHPDRSGRAACRSRRRSLMTCFDQAAARFGWSEPQPQARLDARRRLADRLGLRHRLLSHQHRPGRRAAVPDAGRQGHRRPGRRTRSAPAPTPPWPSPSPQRAGPAGGGRHRDAWATATCRRSPSPAAPTTPPRTTHVAAKACEEVARPHRRRRRRRRATAPSTGADPAEPAAWKTARWRGRAARASRCATAVDASSAASSRSMPRTSPTGLPAGRHGRPLQGPAAMARRLGPQGRHRLRLRRPVRRGARPRPHPRGPRAARGLAPSPPGTIINPLTAYSQFMGGAIWGLSSALHEATETRPARRALHQRQPRRLPDPGERRRAVGGDHHGARRTTTG